MLKIKRITTFKYYKYHFNVSLIIFNTEKELQSQLGLIYPDLIAEYKRVRKEE